MLTCSSLEVSWRTKLFSSVAIVTSPLGAGLTVLGRCVRPYAADETMVKVGPTDPTGRLRVGNEPLSPALTHPVIHSQI